MQKLKDSEITLLKRRLESYELDRMMESKSFIVEGFMIDDLNLKGNTLIIYAFLYSSDIEFTMNQIKEILHIPISSLKRSLYTLLKKELIIRYKTKNHCYYCLNNFDDDETLELL